jgi:hypothetical protein
MQTCIAYKRENVELFADNVYTTKFYCLCFNEIIHLMTELDIKHRGSYRNSDPPILRTLSGRPRINRKRSEIEGPGGPKDARRSNN